MRFAVVVAFHGLLSLSHGLVLSRNHVDLNPMELKQKRSEMLAGFNTCVAQFAQLPNETHSMLDNPALMCAPLASTSMFSVGGSNIEEAHFSNYHVEVGKDEVKGRTHVFVLGGESSGTHFIQSAIAGSYHHQLDKHSEMQSNTHVNFYHLSLPQGRTCAEVAFERNFPAVPVMDDFGCVPGSCNSTAGPRDRDMTWSRPGDFTGPYPDRLMVDIKSVVENYRKRQEKIKVVQVVRDPEMSILANMAFSPGKNAHCPIPHLASMENMKALDLMLEAKDLREVTTICYEQLVGEGKKYMSKQLSSAGFRVHSNNLPDIVDGNLKYPNVQRACTPNAKAYMKLCPDSPHTKVLIENGCK